jgi:hypothetical protein
MSNKKPSFIAFQITETKTTNDKGEPINFWNRVGAAWVNRDGSINIQLHSMPLDGKIQLREPREGDNNGE